MILRPYQQLAINVLVYLSVRKKRSGSSRSGAASAVAAKLAVKKYGDECEEWPIASTLQDCLAFDGVSSDYEKRKACDGAHVD